MELTKDKQKREKLVPRAGIYYPDSNGSTGFSICLWMTGEDRLDSLIFENKWGTFYPAEVFEKDGVVPGGHALEARFFVFGILLNHVLRLGTFEELVDQWAFIWKGWVPMMEDILDRIRKREESGSERIHIDDIVNHVILSKLTKMMNEGPYGTSN